jgi:energy-coupling factor transporter ATP-binding protein EcfA2
MNELEGLPEEELFSILKLSWGYEESEPIEVIGVILVRETEYSKLYFLDRIMSFKTGKTITYPLNDNQAKITVQAFFPPPEAREILKSQIKGTHVKAKLVLSPRKERERHNNPVEVNVDSGSASIVMKMPKEWVGVAYEDDEEVYIEHWVIDQYFEKNKKEIETRKASLEANLKAEEESLLLQKVGAEREFELLKEDQRFKSQELEEGKKKLQSIIDDKDIEIKKSENRIEVNQKKHKKLINEQKTIGLAIKEKKLELQHYKATYQQRIKDMESKLERLKGFIQEKSQTLIDLGLLDEAEHLKLIGKQSEEDKKEGYDFNDIFNSDYRKAASYIQAYMNNKHIYYHRSVIEDFFALLRTNDLIILAGDSGCGKTNLVKSFAEAIGGKHFIIPVKPNWTSAEDLLGFYNPLEKKYVITAFLSALIEAEANPNTPYLICLDEMNLARVEYYFADFLSLLEERKEQPEIFLYSDDDASHTLEEYKTFLRLIDKVKSDHKDRPLTDFVDFLQDEQVNIELHKLCGFHEGDSLLNYHSKLRRILSGYINTPSSIKLPKNVRIIGAINVDETTHYLSPKILDRAHVIKFGNPFLMELGLIKSEVESFDDLDISKPLSLKVEQMGMRTPYPEIDEEDPFVKVLIKLGRDYLSKLGVEFGFRTVRQAQNYAKELSLFSTKYQVALNNFVLHKILPKLMFEGDQKIGNGDLKKDVMREMLIFLKESLQGLSKEDYSDSSIQKLEELIEKSEANDWLVNYWVK